MSVVSGESEKVLASKNLKSNRKSLLINPKFQWSLIGMFAILAVFILGVWYLSSSYFFWDFVKKGQDLQLPADHIYFRFIETQRQKMNILISIVGAISGVGIVIFGLRISNRIAGPIYAITRQLKQVQSQKSLARPFSVRKKDYFQEVPQELNAAFQAMGHDLTEKTGPKKV